MRVVERPDGRRFAEECDCRQVVKLSSAFSRCRIPPKYEDATLESYDTRFPGAHGSLQMAHVIAKRFADDYPAMMMPGRGLMFSGSSGLGKTHLAVGILKVLVQEKSCEGLFCYYQQLLKDIQNSWNAQSGTTELEVLEPVFNAEVLVLELRESARRRRGCGNDPRRPDWRPDAVAAAGDVPRGAHAGSGLPGEVRRAGRESCAPGLVRAALALWAGRMGTGGWARREFHGA